MRPHVWTVVLAALATLAFLTWFPAPRGCGCQARKDKLRNSGRSLFGA